MRTGSRYPWIIYSTTRNRFECLRCKASLKLPLPMEVTQFCGHSKVFEKAHRGCKEPRK